MSDDLLRDLRQTKPFGTLEEMVFLNLLRTADQLLQREVALLRTHDLSFAQYNVLRILRGAGSTGLTCSEISERLVNRDPDVTRLLDRLESRGLVRRSRDPRDRRVVLSNLTREGSALVGELDAPITALHVQQLAHVDRTALQQLNDLLEEARRVPA